MKINFKSILSVLGIAGLFTGLSADAQQNYTITVTPEDIRNDAMNAADPIIPNNPVDLYERGTVRALYAIPSYPRNFDKKVQVNVMKYGIPNNPDKKINKNKKVKPDEKIIVEKYDVPLIENEPVPDKGEPVGKYSMPDIIVPPVKPVENPGPDNSGKFDIDKVPVLKYAVPYFLDNKGSENEK